MPVISTRRVTQAFIEGDAALTTHAKGQALEDLLVYAFKKYPGVRLIERDVQVAQGSEELT